MKRLNTQVIQIKVNEETMERWLKICDEYDTNIQSRLFKQFVDMVNTTIVDEKETPDQIAYYNYTAE